VSITKLEQFALYHVYNTVVENRCITVMYVGFSNSDRDVPPVLIKRGWQFIAMQRYTQRGGGPTVELGATVVHQMAPHAKNRLLGGLTRADECRREHPQETP
jgi:hypothetical protein